MNQTHLHFLFPYRLREGLGEEIALIRLVRASIAPQPPRPA